MPVTGTPAATTLGQPASTVSDAMVTTSGFSPRSTRMPFTADDDPDRERGEDRGPGRCPADDHHPGDDARHRRGARDGQVEQAAQDAETDGGREDRGEGSRVRDEGRVGEGPEEVGAAQKPKTTTREPEHDDAAISGEDQQTDRSRLPRAPARRPGVPGQIARACPATGCESARRYPPGRSCCLNSGLLVRHVVSSPLSSRSTMLRRRLLGKV